MVEILLNHDLSKEKMNTEKMLNGQSLLDMACFNHNELIKLLLFTHDLGDMTDSNCDKVLKLLEAKIKTRKLLFFHEAI
jgi:hypothetical protein